MRSPPPRRAGFTLVEIMVVAAIIGVLASLAIPVIHQMTQRAKRTEREMMVSVLTRAMVDLMTQTPGDIRIAAEANPQIREDQPVDGRPYPWTRNLGDWSRIQVQPDGPRRFRYTVVAERSGADGFFTITAIGDLDGNGALSTRVVEYRASNDIWTPVSDVEAGDAW